MYNDKGLPIGIQNLLGQRAEPYWAPPMTPPTQAPQMMDINSQSLPGLNQGDFNEFLRRVNETKGFLSDAKADGGITDYGGQDRVFGNLASLPMDTKMHAGFDKDNVIIGGPLSHSSMAEPMSVNWGMWAGNHVQNASGNGEMGGNYSADAGMGSDPNRYQALLRAMQEYAYQDSFKQQFPQFYGGQ